MCQWCLGLHHHHLLSGFALAALQDSSTPSHRGGHRRYPAGPVRPGPDPRLYRGHLSDRVPPQLESGRQLGAGSLPLPGWAGNRPPFLGQQLAGGGQCLGGGHDPAIRVWMRHLVWSVQYLSQ